MKSLQNISYKTLFTILFLSLAGIVFFLKIGGNTTKVSAAWWNDMWQYRKAISITNTSGSNQTNTKVRVLFNYDLSSLVTAGKLQSSLNDIRFTDINSNLLTYWIEDSTNNSVDIWLLIPSVPSSGATIYMYYGNSSATTMSNSGATPSSCLEIVNVGITASGNYWIDPDGGSGVGPFITYCDLNTDSGGWTMLFNLDTSDGNKRTWTDTAFWLGIGTTGDVSNSLTADFKSGAYSSLNLGNEMMVLVHNEGTTIYGKALYDVLTAYKTVSLYGVFNAGTTNVTITETRSDLIDFTDPATYNDTFIEETNALKINDKREGDGHGTGVSHTYVRFTTTGGVSNPSHEVIGLGGEHDSNDSCGHWGWDYEAQNHQGYCSIYAIGTDWVDKGYNDYDSCPAGQKDIDYAVFSREATPSLKNISASSPTTEETSPGPIAYWKFDEGVGTTAYDSTSNNLNGSITGATWATEDQCVSGKCLYFNGVNSNNKVDLGTSIKLNPANFSISAWVKADNASSNYGYIFSNDRDCCGTYNGFSLFIQGGKLIGDIWNSTVTNIVSNRNISSNQWTYVNFTYDGFSMKLYINGVLDKSVDYSGGVGSPASFNFSIGTMGLSQGYFTFKGFIDEPKIYPYARTADQIKLDYNSHGSASSQGSSVNLGSNKSNNSLSDGLVGYWKMDEGVGTTTVDSSGNSNTGTLSGAGWTSGKFGIGISLNGSNTYTTFPSIIGNDTNFSVSGWIKLNADQTSRTIFSNQTSDNNSWVVGISDSTTNILKFYLGSAHLYAITPLVSGVWNHFTITYDNGNPKIYINGQLNNSSTDTIVASGTYLNNAIGCLYRSGGCAGQYFNGSLDEFRIYNRALSPAEVSQLYNWAPGPVGYWDFNENTGTVAQDKSGNGNIGTLVNSPTWTQGKIGSALNFNSTNSQYVNFSTMNKIPINNNNYTISAWIKPNLYGTKGIVGWGNWTSYQANALRLHNTGIHHYWYGNDLSATYSNLTNQNWYYITALYDGIIRSIYVNGILASSDTPTPNHNVQPNNLRIASTNNGEYFDGSIDDVKIYNYARTQKQIIEDMTSGAPTTSAKSMTGYWKFDEGNGATIYDSSPQKNNGTLGNGINWFNNGKIGKALQFNNINIATNIGTTSGLNMTTNDFTLSVQYYSYENTDSNIILEQRGSDLNGYLWLVNSDGKVYIFLNDSGASQKVYNFSNSNIPTNKWQHLIVVVNRQNNTAALYQNGIFIQTISISNTTGSLSSNENLRIGYDKGGATFNGILDELKIYNYALTDEEVKQDYNQGSAVSFGTTNQTIGGTTTSLEYCIPGDASPCSPPIAEWNFEENTGAAAYDTSGNNRNLNIYNSPIWTSGNKNGAALDFNGSSQYARRTSDSSFDRTDGQALTVSAWIYPRRLSGQYQNIVVNRSGSGYNWMLYQHTDDGSIQLHGASQYKSSYIPPLNKWTHLEATVTTSGNYSLYANGLLVQGPMAYSYHADAPGELSIGSYAVYEYFSGKIDNVKIYNYAHTPAQIAYDYNRGAPVGWWKLDECQGSTAFDSSGLGNTGAISIGQSGSQNILGTCAVGTSAAWTNGSTGKINSSLNFDGNDDYVNLTPSLSIGQTNYTISAWFKTTTASQDQIVWEQNSSSSTINRRSAMLLTNSGYWGFNGESNDAHDKVPIRVNQWVHGVITVEKNAASNPIKIYENGKLYWQGDSSGGASNLNVGNGKAGIGYKTVSNTEYFNGQIDDVRIYNYAITSEQVKTVYNGGAVNFR